MCFVVASNFGYRCFAKGSKTVMSHNGAKKTMETKKPANSFSLLSQRMNEVQKSKKPIKTQGTQSKVENSPSNLNRSNSSATINLDDDNEDNMSPLKSSESHSGDPDVPDRSYGDYYCQLCDSHMNSDAMWTAHITGKRHQKNVDKGSKDPKYDDLDVESCIKHQIKNVKDPIIGLSYVHEIRRKDESAPPIFTCFLCQATFPTVPLVIEHVLSMKHRMNFMKENSFEDYQLLEATNLKKGHMEPLVMEMALKLEGKYGRGSAKVKQEKLKIPPTYTYSSKRSLETDEEEEKYSRKSLKSEDRDVLNNSKSKKNLFEKDKYGRDVDRRRRYSSDEDEDTYKQPSGSRNHSTYSKKYESSHSRDSYKKDFSYSGNLKMQSFRSRSPPYREPIKEDYKAPYGPEPPSFQSSSSPPYREPIKENYKAPYGPEPPPFQSSSSLQYKEKAPTSTQTHPSTVENKDESQIMKSFVQKIVTLTPELFFNIVLIKLEHFELKNLEEMNLIAKIIKKCQDVLSTTLPPETQVVINQNVAKSIGNVPSPQSSMHQIPHSSLPSRPSQPGDLSFIKEFLDHNKKSSVLSSPIPSTVAQPVGGGIGIPPYQPYGNPNQSYVNSSQMYRNSTPTYRNPSQATHQSSDPSIHNYASSYQNNSFNTATSSNSSAIPGLTLAEDRERQNYSYGISPNHSSHPSYGY